MRTSSLLLPILCACSGPKDSDTGLDERVFVGSVGDAQIGLQVLDGRATAYVCGGDTTRGTWDRWFEGQGDVDAGSLAADAWVLSWDGDAGSITDPQGVVSTWSLADQSLTAGLFDGNDSGCRDGAVVREDDAGKVSFQGTWGCYAQGNAFAEVTPVGTLWLGDVIEARVMAPEGERQFTLSRVTSP